MAKRKDSAKFTFQGVMDVLRGQKETGPVARAYGVPPITFGLWNTVRMCSAAARPRADMTRKIWDLERLRGQKEVVIALLKNF